MLYLNKKSRQKYIAIAFAILVWQAIALLLDNNILLVGPIGVFISLIELIKNYSFWESLFNTMQNVMLGLFIAFVLAIFLATLASRFSMVDTMLEPIISFMKATPLASFVIICLVWVGNRRLSIITVLLIVLPIVYANMLGAYKAIDIKLIEMLHVFRVSFIRRVKILYIPSTLDIFISTLKISVGMAFKAGVAAELIGLPQRTIGNSLYESKIFLLTSDIFAWTISIILMSTAVQTCLIWLIKKLYIRFINRGASFDKD